ncbi:MAG: hypothetical protein KY461_14735, partial [Actinobacteria bacterium]|nr:hypothetical protein [Actinomycetota bacterium]
MRPPARRPLALLTTAGLAASSLAFVGGLTTDATALVTDVTTGATGGLDLAGDPLAAVTAARRAEPVVLTGADIPDWAGAPAVGTPAAYPSGTGGDHPMGDLRRTAHNGTLTVPPGPAGVDVDRVVGYRWDAGAGDWVAIPVQVDERFPHFLANGRSDFSFYSGTDVELTYAWNPTATTTGEEAWKKVAGTCEARYPQDEDEVRALIAAGIVTPGPDETPADHLGPRPDPAAGLDLDDELVFLAGDAGAPAPADAPAPTGVDPASRHEVLVGGPLSDDGPGAAAGAVYLFLAEAETPPVFDHTSGYVELTRHADADRWADRSFWDPADPEKLGTSNTGYGANLLGTVCGTISQAFTEEELAAPRASTDRFPLDGTTVRTAAYEATMSGRWMFRDLAVASTDQNPAAVRKAVPGDGGDDRFGPRRYGPDLVDRWKGRAFQQSPDSTISVVGFEDEQVNWEANSTLLGWKVGPVRAIRELWGADSGTNVTKVETFYRDLVQHRYYVRVHPIPPDGLYTSWDYNRGVAETYFNALRPDGVPIDGQNDDVGQVDDVNGMPAFFDAPDPTFDLPSALYRWEQVAGAGGTGSLVYSLDLTGPTTLGNPAVVPYYRDDACLDDGTGDDPV